MAFTQSPTGSRGWSVFIWWLASAGGAAAGSVLGTITAVLSEQLLCPRRSGCSQGAIIVLGATFGACVGWAQKAVLRLPVPQPAEQGARRAGGGVSAAWIWAKAGIWALFFWTTNEAVSLEVTKAAEFAFIGVLCGAAEFALRSTALKRTKPGVSAWSLISLCGYGVSALVFSRLLMSPRSDHFALLILPCLITEFGTGITLARSPSSQEALLPSSEAWSKLKRLICKLSLSRCILVIFPLIDFVLVLELTQRERYETLSSGQIIDFWYTAEQVAALGPGLLLLSCLGLLLGRAWSCGLAFLPALLLLKQSLDAYSFLSSEGLNMLTWEAWKHYVAVTGGVFPQIRAAVATLVIAWSLKSVLDQVKARHRLQL
jgi:hypothetical protein